jgi:hypothetical protein
VLTPLPPFYYLDNFYKLIKHAGDTYPELLVPAEKAWLHSFAQLSRQAQALLVRMLMRKGELFRSDKLCYDEVGDVQSAAQELEQSGFIKLNPALSARSLALHLLTKQESVDLFAVEGKGIRKEQLLARLPDEVPASATVMPFQVYQLQQAEMIACLSLLFFANTRQDLSQFVVSDLGLQRFESYSLSRERRFFTGRGPIDQLLVLHQLCRDYEGISYREEAALDSLIARLPPLSGHAGADRRQSKFVSMIARDYERLGCFDKALHWFSTTSLPPSRERRARILEGQGRDVEAQQLVEVMLEQPTDQPEFEVALRLDERLRRKKGERIARRQKPEQNAEHLTLDLSQERVELAVRRFYQAAGWQVFFTENHLLCGLFGLAFWDVIFSEQEGAFINPYQQQPLDLYQPEFVRRRQVLIEQRLAEGRRGELAQRIRRVWAEKQGLVNAFVHWPTMTEELLDLALAAMSPELMTELFSTMLCDLRHFRSGMPDLIAFKDGRFIWLEVKGPGDKLQQSQWRWLEVFNRLQVPFKVCYVSESSEALN